MKLICSHADTCLSSYWGGHHLPHIQVPVRRGMSFGELKADLVSELNNGCLMGSDVGDDCWSSGEDGQKWYAAAEAAINDMELKNPATKKVEDQPLFMDLEEQEDDQEESVYAFFLFIEE